MVLSELLLQPSYFRSKLDQYDPKMEVYESNHHELSSSITITHENSSSLSSVNFPMLSNNSSYDHMHNPSSVNMEGFDDVCKWLCDDHNDDNQGIEDASIYVQDDAMEIDSQTGINNLFMAYGDAMEMEHEELAKVIVKSIIKKANPNGSPLERIAFNLFRYEEKQEEAYIYLEQESLRNFSLVFRAFYDIFPYGRFAHLTAGSTIIEAVSAHVDLVHIIDFDICEGSQWPPVIEAIARMKKSLIITSIKLDQDQNSQFEQTKMHLCDFARSFGLNLKVQEKNMAQIVKDIKGIEFIAFNCMVGLPHMGKTRERTQVIDFLKIAKKVLSKNQGIITFGDGEEGERMRNSSDFSSFFNSYLAHYKLIYESMEWGFPSYLNEARIAMETLFLAPFVTSKSWLQKWEERRQHIVFDTNFQKGFGLKGQRMSRESLNEAREMVNEGETPYTIRVEGENQNEMVLEWRGTSLVRVYVWK